MDKEVLRSRLRFFLKVLDGLSKLTPTDVDDKLVDAGEFVVEQDWALDLVLVLVELLSKKGQVSKADLVAKLGAIL